MKLKLYAIMFSFVMVFIPFSGFAEEAVFEGEVTARGQLVHVNGNEAKFDEYGDTKDGIYGAIGLIYEKNSYFMKFNASDIGYDTQKYTLDGGMWGKFKYDLFYDEIPHNITFGAKTFFSGVGDSSLQINGDPNNVSTWRSFDFETKRKRYGGGVKLDLLKPFFLDISAQSEKKEGIKPAGGGGFAGPLELPEPIDYRTDMFKVEAGFSDKPFFASLSYFYSKFENDNQNLDFIMPSLAQNSITLPPDNDYHKVAFKGALFLPYSSKFSVNVGSARAESDGDANAIIATDTFTGNAFKGKVDTDNVDVVLTSNPASFLFGKLFYKYYDRKNKSEDVEDHLGWTDRSLGGQFVFKLPASFRLTAGYTKKRTEYEDRFDAIDRTDDLYSTELAWSGLDFAVFKVGYDYLHRSDHRGNPLTVDDVPDRFWRFDVAPANRDTFKASVDLFPVDNLSVTLGYKYKKTEYEDRDLPSINGITSLGLREDKRDEFFADASYTFMKYASLYGYLDYEKVRTEQFGFHTDSNSWKLRQKEINCDYGIGTDINIIPKKLTLKLNYDYVRSDGSADFTFEKLLTGVTNSNIDIGDWDDYRTRMFSARAVYNFMKSFSVTAGYLYEQFKLEDIQLEDYQYIIGNSRLTGAYKDPNYNANVVFLALTYKF